MKTEKIRLFSYIASAALIICLLMYISLAWYLTTKQADASGIGSNIAGDTLLIDKIEYYRITSSTDITDENGKGKKFTVGEKYYANEQPIGMRPYDALSEAPTEVLMEIKLNGMANIADFSVVTQTTDYIDKLSKKDNNLSSIISFFYIDTIDLLAENTVYNEKYFFDINGTVSSIKPRIDLLDESKELDHIYILIGYYEESIENIYSNNLANDVLSQDIDIEYTCDFKFNIRGEMV